MSNVQITWNSLTPLTRTDITQYEVYRVPQGGGYAASHLHGTVTWTGAATYSWTDTTSHDDAYDYFVIARNSSGASAPSDAQHVQLSSKAQYLSGATLESLKPAVAGSEPNVTGQGNLVYNGGFELGDNRNWNGTSESGTYGGAPVNNVLSSTNAQEGGMVGVLTGDNATVLTSKLIPVNTGKRYYMEVRLKNSGTMAATKFYAGFACYDSTKNPLFYSPPGGTYNYALAANVLTPSTYTIYKAVVTGEDVDLNPANASTNRFRAGTKYITPMLLLNRDVAGGTTNIDYFKIVEISSTVENHPRTTNLTDTGMLLADYVPEGTTRKWAAESGATVGAKSGVNLKTNGGVTVYDSDMLNIQSGIGANLVPNASFEYANTDPLDMSGCAGWTYETNGSPSNMWGCNRETSWAPGIRSGSACLWYGLNSAGYTIPANTAYYMAPRLTKSLLAPKPGEKYKFGGWFITAATIGYTLPSGVTVRVYPFVRITFSDATYQDFASGNITNPSSGSQQELSATFTVPTGKIPTGMIFYLYAEVKNTNGSTATLNSGGTYMHVRSDSVYLYRQTSLIDEVSDTSADYITESGSRKWAAESGAQVFNGKSLSLLTDRHLGNIADGGGYSRVGSSWVDGSSRVLIDFSLGSHLYKTVDYIGDGTDWARMPAPPAVSAAAVTSLSQSGTSTTINVGSGTYYLGTHTVNANSGSVNPGAYGTFYVYFDDPGYASGAMTYQATTDLTLLTRNPYRFYVGKISTATGGGGGGGTGGGGGGGCFSGNVAVTTTWGVIPFGQLPSVVEIINETGTHLADLIVHEEAEREMLDMGNEWLVTLNHLVKRDGWHPADVVFPAAPRAIYGGKVYNLHVRDARPEDQHYILGNGTIVHNMKIE